MENSFWMVFVEGGYGPSFKHTTYESALTESMRLTEKLNKPAYVLQSVSKVQQEKFKITKMEPFADELPF